MQENRIEKLEEEFRPEGNDVVGDITLDVVYDTTVIDPVTGERSHVTRRATYDENVPFGEPWYHTEFKRMVRMRVRYPLEESADHGVLRDPAVTGD